MTSQETLLQQLNALGTATIHEAQGQIGAMDHEMKPIDPTCRMIGRALTVDTRPDDNLMIHYALTKARPGDVLVVDAKGFLEAGPWGDLLTLAAMKRGIVGLVIDGAVRDANTILELGFPVFCKGLSIKGTNKEQAGKVNVPVICAGVNVRPGDIIVGDRDGVVVIKSEDAQSALDSANAREAKEDGIRTKIESGISTVEILGLGPKLTALGLE
ncbi:4-carboxy-4-hydroxy-2-oxoadipate aldolase/oxaloacetate decarboxylase [Orrella marina]|uniref:4-hydroxy-4-methyl-2-oxoglutarate aldolase n=1 Tax=Orrella marina TaxID=2163011 RepID=A0A2R4XGC5_9BURK|nr:4-carboxy-4-hydroxy-2-oxoadipate aldolase/oxaloacetate decarboxylase [Orrella marina]AWB32835.1 4-hydroxy-4-methyl-2-oxoglutarate aldolase [Orrella marina]